MLYPRLVVLAMAAIALSFTSVATQNASGAPRSGGKKGMRHKRARPQRPALKKRVRVVETPLQQAATTGYFHNARAKQVKKVSQRYRADRERATGLTSVPSGRVKRVKARDLSENLKAKNRKQRAKLRRAGLKGLRAPGKTPAELRGTGYEGFARLHYFTSGAGLWSRGGGQVKALIPLNLAELLSKNEFGRLEKAGKVVAAKTPEAARLAAGAPKVKSDGQIAAEARAEIERLAGKARADRRAINVLDLKLANVALLSRESKSYVHMDIWTSSQTHGAIKEYLEDFKANYKNRIFHPNKRRNRDIIEALDQYFAASAKLGETHLFGYQVGLPALDAKTGKPVEDSARIGEGAGMAKAYLDTSGRSRNLEARGVRHWVFQNIEVISDVGLEFGAYLASKTPVSVVVVPTKSGYSGGNPYRVEQGGQVSYQLLEGSAVPASLAQGNAFFNTNTIYQRADLEPIKNIGYELKDNGRIVRLKMNAGDVSLTNRTSLIGGRIGKEYENFKTYGEFGSNGAKLVKAVRSNWSSSYID